MSRLAAVLLATFIGQTFGALAFNSGSVYAPVISADLGFPAQYVGLYFALMSIAGAAAGLFFGGVIHRYGPLRMIQVLTLVSATGALMAGSGSGWLLLFSAPLVGMFGGIQIPASAQILTKAAPPERAGLVFSIKQTGAPLGIGLGGALLPAVIVAIGWQGSLVAIAVLGILVALALEPLRAAHDLPRDPRAPLRSGTAFAPIVLLLAEPRLRRIAVAGLVLTGLQTSLIAYLVSYLHLERGFSLALAGGALAAAQFSSIVARLCWGMVMDRIGSATRVIAAAAVGGALCVAVLALVRADWNVLWVFAPALGIGLTALGWNGVYFAGLARNAPAARVVEVTSAGQIFLYSGTVLGPLVFAGVVSLGVSYAQAFLMLAAISLVVGGWTARGVR